MSTLSTTNLKHPSSGSNNIVLDSSGNTRVTAITDSAGANSSTPAAIANGTAKAWVNFNGTSTVAIRASFNVSSITDNGTGDYTVNFTTALADANYAVTGIATTPGATAGILAPPITSSGNQLAGSVRLGTYTGAGALFDASFANIAIFR